MTTSQGSSVQTGNDGDDGPSTTTTITDPVASPAPAAAVREETTEPTGAAVASRQGNNNNNNNDNNNNNNNGNNNNDGGGQNDLDGMEEDDTMPIPHPAPVVLVHPNPLNENDDGNEDALVDDGDLQVVLPLETFAEDLHMRLGRANGNIYHRSEGKPGVHDGQVMVRLKKKRFIVLDYGIKPNRADLQAASMNPHIRCPKGAGRTRCSVSGCNKVGIPVLLYDSEPEETPSLYLRSGLCFTCQRNLNEKRRTQRKKTGNDIINNNGGGGGGGGTDPRNGLYLFGSAADTAPTLGGQPENKKPRYDSGGPVGAHAHTAAAAAQAAAAAAMTATSPYAQYAAALSNHQQQQQAAAAMAAAATLAHQPVAAAAAALRAQQQQQQQQQYQQQQQQQHPQYQQQQGPVMTLQFPPPAPGTAPLKQASQGHGYAEIGIDLKLASQQAFEDTDRLLETVNRYRQQQQQHGMMMGGTAPPSIPNLGELYNASFASVARSLFLLQQWKQAWDGAAAAAAFAGADQYLANGHVRLSPHISSTVAPPPPMLQSPSTALFGSLQSTRMMTASTGVPLAPYTAAAASGGGRPAGSNTGTSSASLPSTNTGWNDTMAAAATLASVNASNAAASAPPATPKTPAQGTIVTQPGCENTDHGRPTDIPGSNI